jgi:invasion protein IalB
MTDRLSLVLLAGLLLAAASAAHAQTGGAPKLVGQYGEWGVYVSQQQNSRVCFALTQPQERQPGNLRRGPGYIFLSTRPGDNVRNEFSAIVGFPIKEDADGVVQIGSDSFTLYGRNEGAWIRNVAEEARLIEAMRKGRDLVMKTTSTRGNETTDKYSLSGVAQALDRVAQECR